MKNNLNFIEHFRNFVYYATKNLQELYDYGLYDEMIYLVFKQELLMLKQAIGSIINNTDIPNDIKISQLRSEVIDSMKHVGHPSLKKTLKFFEVDTTKLNIRLLHFLNMTTTVICAEFGDDISGKNNKFIEIYNDENEMSNDIPNIFDLSIPCIVPKALISVDEDGNYTTQAEHKCLIVTVMFSQDWLLLETSSYIKSKLKLDSNKGLWEKYMKIMGTPYVSFSNKFGLDVKKLMKTYENNKHNEQFFIDENLTEIERKSDIVEFAKLFYLEGNYDMMIKLYNQLTDDCGEKIINPLFPKALLDKIQSAQSDYTFPPEVLEKIKEKEEECDKSPDPKPKRWLSSIKKIPFGVIKEDKTFSFVGNFISKHGKTYGWNNFMDIFRGIKKCDNKTIVKEWKSHLNERKSRLKSIRKSLDNAVYGHENVKGEIINLVSGWMNGGISGECIGLEGPPGNGKTSIGKNGICKAFIDENGDEFPFVYISLGAANNGSYLFGHHYTFQGSVPGRIADGLMRSKCMNPIFYFDELDKISQTESGKELVNSLIHITDFTQNDSFEDMYFAGIKLDLSKCLFIFSFNDALQIDKILRDRLNIIKTKPLNIKEKITIGKDYLLKDICKEIGWNLSDIKITPALLKYIITSYTLEPGVRKYKSSLKEIMKKLNHDISSGLIKSKTFPLKITEKDVDNILDINKKIRIKMTHTKPTVGLVNGLYCVPGYGIGGIIPLQAMRTVKKGSKDLGNITVTGNLGKVMSESVECAKTVIQNILTPTELKDMEKRGINVHLHAMDASSEKEGPSAGGAITLCLYSLITNKTVRNNIALTGEITLDGQITAIGGVPEKVNGGHQVGCNVILLPEENRQDYDIALRDGWFDSNIRILEKTELMDSVKDNELCVKFVENIYDIIKMTIIEEKPIKHKITRAKRMSAVVATS